jgi:anaerobic selenocysteine-containing dehydrogenase
MSEAPFNPVAPALANAVLKRLIDRDGIDRTFVEAHTEGWPALAAAVRRQVVENGSCHAWPLGAVDRHQP